MNASGLLRAALQPRTLGMVAGGGIAVAASTKALSAQVAHARDGETDIYDRLGTLVPVTLGATAGVLALASPRIFQPGIAKLVQPALLGTAAGGALSLGGYQLFSKPLLAPEGAAK